MKIYDNLAFMKQYIELLRAESLLLRLSTIQLISYFGAWFSNVAIYTLLLAMDVSAEVVAFVAMLHFLSGVFQTPFSGAIIDRYAPKQLMLTLLFIEMASTLALLMIGGVEDLWLLYILIFIKMGAASFYFTAEMSLLPKILKAKDLQLANELHSIIWSLSYTTGMALSGFLVYAFGTDVAFVLDALMFGAAFVLLYMQKIDLVVQKTQESFLSMMQETFSYLKRSPLALHLMILHAFVGLTAFDAVVALMVDQYYASVIATSLALGLLHSSRAVGLVVGPVVLGRFTNNRFLVFIFFAQAFSLLLWAMAMHNFYLSLGASVVVGFFTTTLWSYSYTLLQKNIDEQFYGRIVAYNDMLFLSTAAFTSYGIGFLASHGVSLEVIVLLLGSGFVVGGIYFRWIVKNRDLKEIV